MTSLISSYVIFMHIAIMFLAFYYLCIKYFRFSNNQNETSEDLHNTRTVPPSCFQRTNSNDNDLGKRNPSLGLNVWMFFCFSAYL